MIAGYEKIKMKGFLIPLLLLFTLSSFASADVIIFKDGRKIETERAWEEEGQIKCYRYGGIVGYPKGQIDRIIEGKTDEEKPPVSRSRRKAVASTGVSASHIMKIKLRLRELYLELMNFKDDSNFHRFGFAPGYKYSRWEQRVEVLRQHPDSKLLLKEGVVVGDLLTLGNEYMDNGGRETDYTRFINPEFRKVLELGR